VESSWPARIVVGVDTTDESLNDLDRALALAKRAGSTVVVLHAVGLLEGSAYVPGLALDDIVAAACERTGCPAELIAAPIAENGPPVGVVLRITKRVGGDLIVVGRRGAGFSDRPLGSTSTGILDRADVPVLVVAK